MKLLLGYKVIRNRNWNWQIDVNYWQNRNKVTLPKDIEQIVIDGFTNEGLFAIDGQPLGVIQSAYTLKDTGTTAVSSKPTGVRIVDANGNYITSNEIGIIGDPNPDFKMTAYQYTELSRVSASVCSGIIPRVVICFLIQLVLLLVVVCLKTPTSIVFRCLFFLVLSRTGAPNDVQIKRFSGIFQ